MLKVVEKFEVKYLQVLNEKGKVDSKLMPKLSNNDIKRIYEAMILSRVFDDKAVKLQRQGRLGTFAQSKGQEASQIGSAFALRKEDWIFPSFRESGIYLLRGMPIDLLFRYWAGDERGMKLPNINMFTISIPVGTHLSHAAGFAWGAKIKKQDIVVVTYFGDGATSEGDFHEALNFAGVFNLPIVFICQNNQYAISVPVEKQTKSSTIAQKAIAYGFDGIKVDGNDVFAVYKATKEALDKARKGKPSLIECFTYRLGDHTTSDDAKKYRSDKELKLWEAKDPIKRLEIYMKNKKIWNKDYANNVLADAEETVNDAVKKAESFPKANVEDMFNYTYKELSPNLKEQLDSLKNE